MRVRFFFVLAAALVVPALAGCGSSGGSGPDPATATPPNAPFYLEVTLRPDPETAAAVDTLAKQIAGVDDLGGLIVAELNETTDEPVDFESEVDPWLGTSGGLFFRSFDGEDFTGTGFVLQTSDPEAASQFVEEKSGSDGEPADEASYEGAEFKVEADGTAVGLVDDLFVFAEDRQVFEAVVDAVAGESLADSDEFADALAATPSDALADLYVDIGALIEESGDAVDPETRAILEILSIEPGEATLAASLVPSADRIELDLSTNVTGGSPTAGDAAELLGSLPAAAVAAFATPGFGTQVGELIGRFDATGVPGEVPPNQLKAALEAGGVDVDAISAAVGDGAAFVEAGDGEFDAALVLEATDPDQAADAVASVGTFLRAAGVEGITAAGDGLSGFSVRSPDLGGKPLVVAAEGDRAVVAYGLGAATRGLRGGGETLAEDPGFQAAAEALGETPIAAYVKGPPVLRLIESLIPSGPDTEADDDLEDARPYLEKVEYLAAGTGADGDRSTAKLIVGIAK